MPVPSNRRGFLREAGLLAAGVTLGIVSQRDWSKSGTIAAAAATAPPAGPSHEDRLKALGLILPPPGKPAATLVPAVRTGNLLFVSGHIPFDAKGERIVGKVGRDLTTAQGAEAARRVALTILGVVRRELGSLNQVARVVKTLGMVNCTADYAETPAVINGFSQVLIDVFGPAAGKGARSAVGMASLPLGVPVEVEIILEVRDS